MTNDTGHPCSTSTRLARNGSCYRAALALRCWRTLVDLGLPAHLDSAGGCGMENHRAVAQDLLQRRHMPPRTHG